MDLSTEVAIRLSLVDREPSPVSPPGALSAHTAPSRHSEEDIPQLTKVSTPLQGVVAVLNKRGHNFLTPV